MASENEDKRLDEVAELSDDQLEEVAGGYIIRRPGLCCPYNVIDEETGKSRGSYQDRWQAERRADDLGIGKRIINADEYQQIFGHKFVY